MIGFDADINSVNYFPVYFVCCFFFHFPLFDFIFSSRRIKRVQQSKHGYKSNNEFNNYTQYYVLVHGVYYI